MKQFLKVTALAACLLLGACAKTPQQQVEVRQSLPQPKTWQIGNYVDEFGEPTGRKYVYTTIEGGTFSNSATQNSQLTAIVEPFRVANISGDTVGGVTFRLLEYGKHPAKGKGVLNISVKDNDGHVIKGLGYNDNRGTVTIEPNAVTGFNGDTIFSMLKAGGHVMFSIETAKAPYSTYKFSIINAEGLMEAIEVVK
ncbi:MAG: hypothetical protein NC131_09905 [Roseburia sp.]|nr:hypothetical protein [Roseburia sp.]